MTLADLDAAARTLARETLTDLDRQGVDRLGADWWCGRLSFALEALCNSLDELDDSEEMPGDDLFDDGNAERLERFLARASVIRDAS